MTATVLGVSYHYNSEIKTLRIFHDLQYLNMILVKPYEVLKVRIRPLYYMCVLLAAGKRPTTVTQPTKSTIFNTKCPHCCVTLY